MLKKANKSETMTLTSTVESSASTQVFNYPSGENRSRLRIQQESVTGNSSTVNDHLNRMIESTESYNDPMRVFNNSNGRRVGDGIVDSSGYLARVQARNRQALELAPTNEITNNQEAVNFVERYMQGGLRFYDQNNIQQIASLVDHTEDEFSNAESQILELQNLIARSTREVIESLRAGGPEGQFSLRNVNGLVTQTRNSREILASPSVNPAADVNLAASVDQVLDSFMLSLSHSTLTYIIRMIYPNRILIICFCLVIIRSLTSMSFTSVWRFSGNTFFANTVNLFRRSFDNVRRILSNLRASIAEISVNNEVFRRRNEALNMLNENLNNIPQVSGFRAFVDSYLDAGSRFVASASSRIFGIVFNTGRGGIVLLLATGAVFIVYNNNTAIFHFLVSLRNILILPGTNFIFNSFNNTSQLSSSEVLTEARQEISENSSQIGGIINSYASDILEDFSNFFI
jgi:hypothetical protein